MKKMAKKPKDVEMVQLVVECPLELEKETRGYIKKYGAKILGCEAGMSGASSSQ